MISKVLVANRGEIAIRAFRAAYELGIGTVAVYPDEDRNSAHRVKADESYQIGEPGHPVRAYLNVEEIVATAQECGADAIYPGYGFSKHKGYGVTPEMYGWVGDALLVVLGEAVVQEGSRLGGTPGLVAGVVQFAAFFVDWKLAFWLL